MAWTIEIDIVARKELNRLDSQISKRILKFLFERLAFLEDPRSIGESLEGAVFGDYWKYRVGDYRLISSIEDKILKILIVRIGNRKEIYR